jgi:hypothetical protein
MLVVNTSEIVRVLLPLVEVFDDLQICITLEVQ